MLEHIGKVSVLVLDNMGPFQVKKKDKFSFTLEFNPLFHLKKNR